MRAAQCWPPVANTNQCTQLAQGRRHPSEPALSDQHQDQASNRNRRQEAEGELCGGGGKLDGIKPSSRQVNKRQKVHLDGQAEEASKQKSLMIFTHQSSRQINRPASEQISTGTHWANLKGQCQTVASCVATSSPLDEETLALKWPRQIGSERGMHLEGPNGEGETIGEQVPLHNRHNNKITRSKSLAHLPPIWLAWGPSTLAQLLASLIWLSTTAAGPTGSSASLGAGSFRPASEQHLRRNNEAPGQLSKRSDWYLSGGVVENLDAARHLDLLHPKQQQQQQYHANGGAQFLSGAHADARHFWPHESSGVDDLSQMITPALNEPLGQWSSVANAHDFYAHKAEDSSSGSSAAANHLQQHLQLARLAASSTTPTLNRQIGPPPELAVQQQRQQQQPVYELSLGARNALQLEPMVQSSTRSSLTVGQGQTQARAAIYSSSLGRLAQTGEHQQRAGAHQHQQHHHHQLHASEGHQEASESAVKATLLPPSGMGDLGPPQKAADNSSSSPAAHSNRGQRQLFEGSNEHHTGSQAATGQQQARDSSSGEAGLSSNKEAADDQSKQGGSSGNQDNNEMQAVDKNIEPRQRRRLFNRILKKAEWNHLFFELSKVFLRYFLDLALKDIIGKQSGGTSSSSGSESGRKKLDAQSELADLLRDSIKTAISNI